MRTRTSGSLRLLLLVVVCLSSGCATRPKEYARVKVYFATDRRRSTDDGLYFGRERGNLTWGVCDVDVVVNDRPGKVERPRGATTLPSNYNPLVNNAGLYGVQELRPEDWSSGIKGDIESGRNSKECLVFVHGYNQPFPKAMYHAAQLAYDVGFQGVPVVFSWPSQAEILWYMADEDSAQWAAPHLKEMLARLADIAKVTGVKDIDLFSHSMGARVLCGALRAFYTDYFKKPPVLFNEIVLAAADVDVDIFKGQIMPEIREMARHWTLYASASDRALNLSRLLHRTPRLGQAGKRLLVQPEFDTVDVSGIDTSWLGHTYYGDSDLIVRDLQAILHPELARIATHAAGSTYWVIPRPAS